MLRMASLLFTVLMIGSSSAIRLSDLRSAESKAYEHPPSLKKSQKAYAEAMRKFLDGDAKGAAQKMEEATSTRHGDGGDLDRSGESGATGPVGAPPTPAPRPTPAPAGYCDKWILSDKAYQVLWEWGDLDGNNDAEKLEACKAKCQLSTTCNGIMVKQSDVSCTTLTEVEASGDTAGFYVWLKDCETAPAPTPAPAPGGGFAGAVGTGCYFLFNIKFEVTDYAETSSFEYWCCPDSTSYSSDCGKDATDLTTSECDVSGGEWEVAWCTEDRPQQKNAISSLGMSVDDNTAPECSMVGKSSASNIETYCCATSWSDGGTDADSDGQTDCVGNSADPLCSGIATSDDFVATSQTMTVDCSWTSSVPSDSSPAEVGSNCVFHSYTSCSTGMCEGWCCPDGSSVATDCTTPASVLGEFSCDTSNSQYVCTVSRPAWKAAFSSLGTVDTGATDSTCFMFSKTSDTSFSNENYCCSASTSWGYLDDDSDSLMDCSALTGNPCSAVRDMTGSFADDSQTTSVKCAFSK